MFCFKCGKEIVDEAIVCPYCGCATNNYKANNNTNTANSMYSDDYLAIREFADKAKSIYTQGILAAVLCFGIGIIFSIIVMCRKGNIQIPEVTTTNPNELAELESAKKKFNNGYALAGIPFIAIGICIFVALVIVPFM